MNRRRQKTPPRAKPEGRAVANQDRSVYAQRSPDYPTFYCVGRVWRGARVFWHPFHGVSLEMDHAYLVALPDGIAVEWEISDELWAALVANPELIGALPDGLMDAIHHAEDCARERDGLVAANNAELIGGGF